MCTLKGSLESLIEMIAAAKIVRGRAHKRKKKLKKLLEKENI